ncbi:MAG: CusA/CzcA family heavy metal efflux RND transporter [Chitinophagaceae bacterium]
MLDYIIQFSIRNKLIVGLLTIGLFFFGIYETSKLPIDAVPDITNNQVQVITVAPSFGATDIERLVTFPIEQANSNINGIKEVRSFSRFGLSLVTIVFEDDVDVYWARQQVAERLQKVQAIIPKGIGTPELGPITTGLGEIYQYVVRPKKGYEQRYNETELRTIQDWIVRRQLLGVKGVAEVSSFGGKLKQYEIAVNANKLQSYHLTIDDVFAALEKNNQNTGGAYIEKGPTVLFIRSEGLIGTQADIENIAVKNTTGGTPIFLRDVATINIGYATRYGAMCFNDQGEVAGAVVMMLKGANSSEVVKNVKERIAAIQKTLPEGVVIEPFLDRTKMVNNAISTVEKNLLEGALIVVFILVLFLGNLRAGLLVASVIPLAMLFAIIMMNMFGVSGNLMSLGALDFGLIVDGAVIIVEAVMHQLSHSKTFSHVNKISQPEMDKQVHTSASKMMNSAVFGQIIILIVYLPIFSLQGIEGKMFKPMAQTVAFALIGAFILSLTYIPMMSALVLSKKINHQPNWSDKMMFRLERWYQHQLERVLNFHKVVIAFVLGLFALAIVILSQLGGEFIPALEEGDFAVDTRVLTGSNLNTTIAFTQKAAGILKAEFPEVDKVVTKIGSGEVPTDPMPMEASDMMVILKDKSQWTSATTFNELAEKMSAALAVVPGITTAFQYPVQMRFNELMTGARQDVVCKIFGEDLDTLAVNAARLGTIVSKVQGVQDVYVEPVTGMPQVVITYDRAAIAQYQLNIADINRIVNTAFAGQSGGLVFEGEKRFDVVVRLGEQQRQNIDDIKNLLIPLPNGTQIPLHQLADVSIKNGPNQIQREDAKRRIVVGFNVRGRDVQSIVHEVQQKVEQQIKFPAGYYVTYGGTFENLNEAKQRLMIAVPVSLILIFILLFFAFGSVKHGLLIYSAIPLSAIGGILFLALRGMPFSISAGIGFIALFGVAVLNGIVLVAEFNRVKASGVQDLKRVVVMGTKVRLRPVLMTAFVASLGFLPMALSNGAGAEVQRPLATVVIGGLLIATLLTLFVLPILYLMFEGGGNSAHKKHAVAATLLLLMGCIPFTQVHSQATTVKSYTLQAAIDTALKHNLNLQQERLKVKYAAQMQQTAVFLPPTNVVAEVGQINSAFVDNKLSVSQSFSLPVAYQRQRTLLMQEWKLAQQQVAYSEFLLKRWVTTWFYQAVVIDERIKLLRYADTLQQQLLQRAEARLKAGEANVLEASYAALQRSSLEQQIVQWTNLRQESILQLKWLLQETNDIHLTVNEPQYNALTAIDSTLLAQHPLMLWWKQQQAIANANYKVEKAKLLPEFNLGYVNQTFRGFGADEKLYTTSNRFNTAQLGVGIPIFAKSQKARIKAAQTNIAIAAVGYEQQLTSLKTQYQRAVNKLATQLQLVQLATTIQLPKAKQIIETANLKLQKGDINYLEWVLLVNQAIQTQLEYIDKLEALNNATIQIQYLVNN